MDILPWPNAARMAFAVRDDDVSFFTQPEKLERLYENALRKRFKITFSVIPMQKATNDPNVPPAFRGRNDCYSVGENKALIVYLNELIAGNLVDVVQHGYTHEGTSQRPEMPLYGERVGEVLAQGKLILEKTFNTRVQVFVPPWESLGRYAWRAVSDAEMSLSMSSLKYLLSAPPSLSMIVRLPEASFSAATRRGFFSAEVIDAHGVLNISTLYNHAASMYGDNLSAGRSFKAFEAVLEDVYARRGCLAVGTHYWQYFSDWEEEISNNLLKTYFDRVFEAVNAKEDIWKTGLNDVAEWIKLKKTVLSRVRGSEVEVSTPKAINGLTLRLSNGEEILDKSSCTHRSEVSHRDYREIVLDADAGGRVLVKRLKKLEQRRTTFL